MNKRVKTREWKERLAIGVEQTGENPWSATPMPAGAHTFRPSRRDPSMEYLEDLKRRGIEVVRFDVVERPSAMSFNRAIVEVTLAEYADAPPPPVPPKPRHATASTKVWKRWSSLGEGRRAR